MTIDGSLLEDGPPQLQVPTCRCACNGGLIVLVSSSVFECLVNLVFISISNDLKFGIFYKHA